tara:strand:+ start:108 stop:1211 length:1104 start_codon:yes stop_codon:yes gene_type:complete
MDQKLLSFFHTLVKSNFKQLNKSQQFNLADLLLAFFYNTSFSTYDIASGLSGETSTKHKNKRLIYFLDSLEINLQFWKSIVLTIFSLPGFKLKSRKVITLAIDATTLKDDFWLLAISVSYKGRGIPILIKSWEGVNVKYTLWDRVRETLKDLREILPVNFKYEILADRGFQGDVVFALCEELGLDYVIRVNDSYKVKTKGGKSYIQLSLYNDGYYFIESFGKNKCSEGVNLVVNTKETSEGKARWYLATNIVSDRGTIVSKYEQRFLIEETFKDLKSKLHWEKYTKKIPTNDRLIKNIIVSSLSYTIQTAIGNQLKMSDSERKVTSIFNKLRQTFRRGNKQLEKIIMKFQRVIFTYISRNANLFVKV